MRRQRLTAPLVGVLAVFAAALGITVPACFKPDHPPCAFTCIDPPHTCPSGYTCGADNLCHDPNTPASCGIELSDGAATTDTGAPNDGGADHGP